MAKVVAENIANAIVKRNPYKKVMKSAIMRAKKLGAVGMKVCVGGRLNGAEIARTECSIYGKVPLHTLRYNIDYHCAEAHTISGIIGVKVWVCNGEVKEKQGE